MTMVERGGAAFAIASRANQIRQRLYFPPNAVRDDGIDLRRHRKPQIKTVSVQAEKPKIKVIQEQAFTYPRHSVAEIRDITCEYFEVTLENIQADCRKPKIAYARHVAIYLARTRTRKSWGEITPFFAYRDHTTLLHSCKKITRMLDAGDLTLQGHLNAIWETICANRPAPALPTKPQSSVAIQLENQESLPQPKISSLEETGAPTMDTPASTTLSDNHGKILNRDCAHTPGSETERS